MEKLLVTKSHNAKMIAFAILKFSTLTPEMQSGAIEMAHYIVDEEDPDNLSLHTLMEIFEI